MGSKTNIVQDLSTVMTENNTLTSNSRSGDEVNDSNISRDTYNISQNTELVSALVSANKGLTEITNTSLGLASSSSSSAVAGSTAIAEKVSEDANANKVLDSKNIIIYTVLISLMFYLSKKGN
jgi:hypothetical protein